MLSRLMRGKTWKEARELVSKDNSVQPFIKESEAGGEYQTFYPLS